MASSSTDAWDAPCFSLSVTYILTNVILNRFRKILEQQHILEQLNFIGRITKTVLEDVSDVWISILLGNLTNVVLIYHNICKLYQMFKFRSKSLFLTIWSKSEQWVLETSKLFDKRWYFAILLFFVWKMLTYAVIQWQYPKNLR